MNVVGHVRRSHGTPDLHGQAHGHRRAAVDAPAPAEDVELAGDLLGVVAQEQRGLHGDVRSEVVGVGVGARGLSRGTGSAKPQPESDGERCERGQRIVREGRTRARAAVDSPDEMIVRSSSRHDGRRATSSRTRSARRRSTTTPPTAVERDDRVDRVDDPVRRRRCARARGPGTAGPCRDQFLHLATTHASHSACRPGSNVATPRYEPRAGSPNNVPAGRSALHARVATKRGRRRMTPGPAFTVAGK